MSGVWSNLLVLDIAFPSNGSLTPGSGTVYIGGPRLPAELVAAGMKGAIVFYSVSGDTLVEYYFLAYQLLPDPANPTDNIPAIVIGSKNVGDANLNFAFNAGAEGDAFPSTFLAPLRQSASQSSVRIDGRPLNVVGARAWIDVRYNSVQVNETQSNHGGAGFSAISLSNYISLGSLAKEIRATATELQISHPTTNSAPKILMKNNGTTVAPAMIENLMDSLTVKSKQVGFQHPTTNSAPKLQLMSNGTTVAPAIIECLMDILNVIVQDEFKITFNDNNSLVSVTAPVADDVLITVGDGTDNTLINGGTGNNYTTSTDADIDTWLSASSTQTVGGVANTVCTAVWRISYDRVLDSEIRWIFPAVPANLNFALPLPPAFTAGGPDDRALWRGPSNPPGSRVIIPNVIGDNGAFAVGGNINALVRLTGPFSSILMAHSAANALNIDRLFCHMTYLVDKP